MVINFRRVDIVNLPLLLVAELQILGRLRHRKLHLLWRLHSGKLQLLGRRCKLQLLGSEHDGFVLDVQ